MPTLPPVHQPTAARAPGRSVEVLLDQALIALANGKQRAILDLVRDNAGALGAMAGRLGASRSAVSQDLSMFHSLEFERMLEDMPAAYDGALLDAAGIETTDRVLDVGCGTGATSRAAARLAREGSVLGVDLSPALVRRAAERSRAETLHNVRFERADAEDHQFTDGSFDVVLSRFGTMYFRHPPAAFAHLAAALRPGGRLAMLVWQGRAANEWITVPARALAGGPPAPDLGEGAFSLADPDKVDRLLAGAGFTDVHVDEVREPMCLGPDTAKAYAMVSTQGLARSLLDGLADEDRKARLNALRATLASADTPDGVLLGSAAWLVQASRH